MTSCQLQAVTGAWKTGPLRAYISEFIVPQRDRPKDLSGDIPWCRIEDFDGIYLSASKSNLGVSAETVQAMSLRVFPRNTVIVSCSADLGRCAIIRKPLVTNQTFIGLVPSNNIDPLFLYYYMTHLAPILNGMATGATIKYLSKEKFQSLSVRIPTLPDQQRIVDILDEAFGGIETAKASAEKSLRSARDLFESHLESIFIERGKEWVEKPLRDLCDIKHGFAFKGEFFAREGEYVLLTPGNFFETGGYRDRGDKQKYYTGEIPPGFVLLEGDLLVAMTEQAAGLLGSPILVPESEKFLHNQRLGLVQKKDGVPWLNEFFFHVFNTRHVRREIHASASGVKVRHTSPTKIGDVVVRFPPDVDEQRAIVAKLNEHAEQTERLETLYRQKIATLEALKRSLLHHAFTGQLTAGDPIQLASDPIPFPAAIAGITTTDLHAGILAMACQFHEAAGRFDCFTHVKAEKIAHMVEARLGIDLGRQPVKDAAGPNDFNHLKKVEHRARKANFFDFKQTAGGAYRVQKLRGFDRHIEKTRAALGDRIGEVEEILRCMLPMDVRQAEIVATIYAGWNNLLLDGKHPSDEEIVFESRENWHPDKLKIERERFFKAIEWMRQKGIVPEGKGKRVTPKRK